MEVEQRAACGPCWPCSLPVLGKTFTVGRLVMLVLILSVVGFFLWLYFDHLGQSVEYLHNVLWFVEEYPVWGLGAMFLIIVLGCVFLGTLTMFCLTSGFLMVKIYGNLYGFLIALAITYPASLCGIMLAFSISRFLFREPIKEWAWNNKTIRALDSIMEKQGLKVVILLRLSWFPFNLFNYLMGATSISARDFFLGSLIIIVPAALDIFIATGIENIFSVSWQEAVSNPYVLALYITGTILSIVLTIYMAYLCNEELRKMSEEHATETELQITLDPNTEEKSTVNEGS